MELLEYAAVDPAAEVALFTDRLGLEFGSGFGSGFGFGFGFGLGVAFGFGVGSANQRRLLLLRAERGEGG